jgi:tRNA (Thr-GGU) A37 N-methylase
MEFTVVPVGSVVGGREDHLNTDHWGGVTATIVLEERFGDRALTGLDGFSHVEVVFLLDRFEEREDYRTPMRTRGRDDLPPVGVFCDHGPRRPNRLGVSFCEVIAVDGNRLEVRGLDAVEGTPVLDIKPAMRQFLPGEVRQPEWVDRLMSEYYLP